MTIYLPSKFIRHAQLSRVRGPAILHPLDQYGATFLVAGGDEARVVFLTQQRLGTSFEQRLAENWHGAAIEGVEFEVDPGSIFSVQANRRLGCLCSNDGQLGIVTREKGAGGFVESRLTGIAQAALPRTDQDQIGFYRWRAIVRDTDNRIFEVFCFDSDRPVSE